MDVTFLVGPHPLLIYKGTQAKNATTRAQRLSDQRPVGLTNRAHASS